jgi:hypothetical protein
MKKTFMLVMLLALSSCTVVKEGTSILFPARYDTNEYELINWIRTTAELSIESCQDTDVSRNNFDTLYKSTLEFKNFTEYQRRNESLHSMATNLHTLAEEGLILYNNEQVSTFFCQNSLLQIVDSTVSIQQVTGRKRR